MMGVVRMIIIMMVIMKLRINRDKETHNTTISTQAEAAITATGTE